MLFAVSHINPETDQEECLETRENNRNFFGVGEERAGGGEGRGMKRARFIIFPRSLLNIQRVQAFPFSSFSNSFP